MLWPHMSNPTQTVDPALEAVSAARWRMAILVAFNKPLLGTPLIPGLSIGMLLGVLVIVAAWVLTWIYVRWANTHYDASLRGLRS